MKQCRKVIIIAALICFTAATYAFAQTGEEALKHYNEYYNKDKFNALAGENGLLTEDEWKNNRTQKEAEEFGNFRWERAIRFDADGDGALDIHEASAYKQAERQALINNKTALPYLYKNQEWLKKHPHIAKKLISNKEWLKNHPKVATEIYKNKEWLNQHPEVAKAAYANKEWLNNHPEVAKEAYKNRKFLSKHPEFSKDLHDHRKYLNEHPKAAKKAYKKAKSHPKAAKKAYLEGKKHPRAVKKAAKHPKKAKKIYKTRKK